MNGIFCDILSGKLAATFINRDERVAAFMDIQPVNPGHVLVVPIRHVVGLEDLNATDGEAVFVTAQRVARALRKSGLRCEGVNLFLAAGAAAMQEVFHLPLHVFPRFSDDGFGLKFSESNRRKPSRASLEATAAAIAEALRKVSKQSPDPTPPGGMGQI